MAADLTFDSQLGKTAGLDSLKSSLAKNENGSTTHLTVGRTASFSTTVGRATVVYQGPYSELQELQKSLLPGTVGDDTCGLSGASSDTGAEEFGEPRVSGSELRQGKGNVGTLTVQYTQNYHRCMWSFDFVEVSKPIRTWHADKKQGAPDLAKIREWEKLEQSNPAKYWAYETYVSGQWTAMTGDTLKLAKFISKGIESYPRYAPCVTCTLLVAGAPDLGEYPVGEVGSPACPNNWKDVAGREAKDLIAKIEGEDGEGLKWLRTASKATTNSDGTFTWTMSWMGADSIEEDLYE